jgi:hypothetical protein
MACNVPSRRAFCLCGIINTSALKRTRNSKILDIPILSKVNPSSSVISSTSFDLCSNGKSSEPLKYFWYFSGSCLVNSTILLTILVACLMIVSGLWLVGVYSELMMSACISAIGWDSKKCSEQSDSWPFLGREGRGVLESYGAIPRGRPSSKDVPRSWTMTIPQRRIRRWHSSSVNIPCVKGSWCRPSSMARRTRPPTSRQSERPCR